MVDAEDDTDLVPPLGIEGDIARYEALRFHARAWAHWQASRDGREMPAIRDFHRMRSELGPGLNLLLLDAGRPADPRPWMQVLSSRWTELAAQRTPARFRLEQADAMWEGLLLPLAGGDDRVRGYAVMAARLGTRVAPSGPIADAVSKVAWERLSVPAPCPWSAGGSGAASLLDGSANGAPDASALLARARTWAALAAGAPPPARPGILIAALAAAYSLLVSSESRKDDAPRTIADRVFGNGPDHDISAVAAALAHGRRLGLSSAGFVALLERVGGEFGALADAECRARDPSPPLPTESEPDTPVLTILPLDRVPYTRGPRAASLERSWPAGDRAVA